MYYEQVGLNEQAIKVRQVDQVSHKHLNSVWLNQKKCEKREERKTYQIQATSTKADVKRLSETMNPIWLKVMRVFVVDGDEDEEDREKNDDEEAVVDE